MFAISKDIHNKKAVPCKYMAKASEDEAQRYAVTGLSTIEDWKPKADLICAKMILLENTGFPYSPSCVEKNWSLFNGHGVGAKQLTYEFKTYSQGLVGFKKLRPPSSSSVDIIFAQVRDHLYKELLLLSFLCCIQ
jgi:hypothetical protein